MGLGAIAAASEAGALLGPLWGGGITELWGWRWVFWINLPMAAPFALLAWRAASHERHRGRIDYRGAALLGLALAILTFALVDDPNAPRPLVATGALLAVATGLGAAFVRFERVTAEPMLRLGMLVPRPVWVANVVNLLVGAGLITVLIGVPLFANLVLLEDPLSGGLTLLRLTVAVPIGALAGGWLAGRWSIRGTASLGVLLASACFLGLQAWDRELSEALRSLPQVVGGFGFGLAIAPLSAAVLQHVREDERATAASWLTLSRVVGMLLGAALLTSRGLGRFYARAGSIEFGSPEFDALVAEAQVSTFREVFIAAAVVLLAASVLALFLERTRREDGEAWWTVG